MELFDIAKSLRDIELPRGMIPSEFKFTYDEECALPVCEIIVAVSDDYLYMVHSYLWTFSPMHAQMHANFAMGAFWAAATVLDQLGQDHGFVSSLAFVAESDYIPSWTTEPNWINLH